MAVRRIRSAYVVVTDMDRAQSFYEGLLGKPPAFRDREAWSQFKLDGAALALSSPDEAATGATGAVIVFDADDLDGAVERVQHLGGRCLGMRDMGAHGRVMSAADPDGNVFQIFAASSKAGEKA
jgi:predicted enzyme related to lactoylglutathione lyase